MKCTHCNKELNIDDRTSSSLKFCPFCGKGFTKEEKPQFYENSKDALAAIAKDKGAEFLLSSQLKNCFSDYAPAVPKQSKKIVREIFEIGAAQILKGSLNASQSDKEIAIKKAIQKITTETFYPYEVAEAIICEFTVALGWQVIKPTPPLRPPAPPPEKLTGTVAPPSAKLQSEKKLAQSAPSGSIITYSNATGITAKIINGEKRNLEFGPYKWRVLNVQSDKALLITEDVIKKRPYNYNLTYVTWETCALRQYLNGEFYNKFNSECKSQILLTNNNNPDNPQHGTKGGNNTQDHIFLLSIDEVKKYFSRDSGRVAKHAGMACLWWLRSPGLYSSLAAYVHRGGSVVVPGYHVFPRGFGVRPAFWLNLKS